MSMLQVSDNQRYLVEMDEKGRKKPFFWLGDTAWVMFQKLTDEQIRNYFENRKEKHFNVIQVVIANCACEEDRDGLMLDWTDEIETVKNGDFAQIVTTSPYWNKIDRVIDMAAEYNLYLALLPVWGSMVKKGYLNMNNVERYTNFLMDRYGEKENIIWTLGGDIRGDVGYDVWNAMGMIIKKRAKNHLVTFHPFGRTSSALWFNDAKWIDLNMFQSGHRRYDQKNLGQWDDNKKKEEFFGEDNWRYVERELKGDQIRPVLDGEPSYEGLPQGLHDTTQPYWKACDVRRYAYWSVFEGACGHTYGHNAIMQFYRDGDTRYNYGPKEYWDRAMNAPGSMHMKYLYDLMNSVDFTTGVHENNLIVDYDMPEYGRVTALKGKGFLFIYNYLGRKFTLDLSKLDFNINVCDWMNPENGRRLSCTDWKNYQMSSCKDGLVEFEPPKREPHNDWVLVCTE